MSGNAPVLSSYYYPTAVSWGYPHLELFAVGQNPNTVYWKYRGLDSPGTTWKSTDGSLSWVGGALTSFDTLWQRFLELNMSWTFISLGANRMALLASITNIICRVPIGLGVMTRALGRGLQGTPLPHILAKTLTSINYPGI